jgi:hypothetical protein
VTVTQAIFVGSVCTTAGPGAKIIPFTRDGNEVIFYLYNANVTGTGGNTFYPGAAYGELAWNTGVGSFPQQQSISFNGSPNPPVGPLLAGSLVPPASASAMIVDAFLLPGGQPGASIMPIVVFSGSNNENAGQLSAGTNSGSLNSMKVIGTANNIVCTTGSPLNFGGTLQPGTYRLTIVCACKTFASGNYPQVTNLQFPSQLGSATTTTMSTAMSSGYVLNPVQSSPTVLESPPDYPALLRVGYDSSRNAVDTLSLMFVADVAGTFNITITPQNSSHEFYASYILEQFATQQNSVDVANGRFRVPLLNGGNTISATMLQDPGNGSAPQYLDVVFAGYVEDPAHLTM